MKPGAIGFALSAVFLAGAFNPAAATVITFSFTGQVTAVPLDEVGTGVDVGTPIEGSYTFESTAADLIAGGTIASFQMAGAPYEFTVDIGGNVFGTSDALAINLFNASVDQYGVLACFGDLSCSGDLSLSIFLEDGSGTALANDLLPVTPPTLTSFPVRDFHLVALVNGSQLQIDGRIDTLVCTEGCAVPAPEPGLFVLFGTGGAIIAFRHRSRTRR
jgi:hypothetical protein